MTMSHDQREELTAHLSSHIIQTELSTFQNSLRAKVSKVDDEILNDPEVRKLQEIIRQVKVPLEQETVQNFERIHFIKGQLQEDFGEKMDSKGSINHEVRMKEIKSKLNQLYKRMISIAQDLDFGGFGKLAQPEELKPSFDRLEVLLLCKILGFFV